MLYKRQCYVHCSRLYVIYTLSEISNGVRSEMRALLNDSWTPHGQACSSGTFLSCLLTYCLPFLKDLQGFQAFRSLISTILILNLYWSNTRKISITKDTCDLPVTWIKMYGTKVNVHRISFYDKYSAKYYYLHCFT